MNLPNTPIRRGIEAAEERGFERGRKEAEARLPVGETFEQVAKDRDYYRDEYEALREKLRGQP